MDSGTARAAFARMWERLSAAGNTSGHRLGAFTLRPTQVRAAARIRSAFDEFGGALLADPPGTGKTIVALAVAAALCDAALVLAPSALRAQWERAARRARVAIHFVSLEAMSRGATADTARLVIVDEAHHVRTPSTRRYAGVAAACVGARVLLLTATPVVNRRADRGALLALFLGAAAATLDAESAARCIIRRPDTGGDSGGSRPHVRRLSPLEAPPGGRPASIADALTRLPPPFPVADGAPALALVRISLAMAWSSSLAALDMALRRRMQRGEALADALVAGRWPTRAALRQWLLSDDATQLAFSELDPAHDRVPDDALAVLRTHLTAVRSLRATIRPFVTDDASARADALRALLRDHPARRMVVFASHAATIRALWTAMRADAGVVAITGAGHGSTVRAAAGRWSREDVLRALGPLAPPLPTREDDPARRSAVRVLLATDLLSEGIELQGVGILVHADRPWTPARLEQREGRITRLTTRVCAGTVLVTRFRAPAASAPLLRLGARLVRKQRVRSRAVSNAEEREELDEVIRGWRNGERAAPAHSVSRNGGRAAPAGFVSNCATAFLALVRAGTSVRLVAGRHSDKSRRTRRWRVSVSPRSVHAIARLGPALRRPSHAETHEVRSALARWERRAAERRLLGRAPDARSPLQRRLHECADRILRATPLAVRARRGAELEALVLSVSTAEGAGIEHQLSRLLKSTNTDDAIEAGLRTIAAAAGRSRPSRRPRSALVALLVAHATVPPVDVKGADVGPASVWPAGVEPTSIGRADPTAAEARPPAAPSRDRT